MIKKLTEMTIKIIISIHKRISGTVIKTMDKKKRKIMKILIRAYGQKLHKDSVLPKFLDHQENKFKKA